jgi:hypothetical protein
MSLSTLLEAGAEVVELNQLLKSPDHRWEILQNWIDAHAGWRSRIEAWALMTPDGAYNELRNYIAHRAGLPGPLLGKLVGAEIETMARSAIETVQELYRERADLTAPPRRLVRKNASNKNEKETRKSSRKKTAS